jgi:hypothetical protein
VTAIDRTAYPGFSRAPQLKELIDLYTPMPADVAFVSTTARGLTPSRMLIPLANWFSQLMFRVFGCSSCALKGYSPTVSTFGMVSDFLMTHLTLCNPTVEVIQAFSSFKSALSILISIA